MASILDQLTLEEIALSKQISQHYHNLKIEQRESLEQLNLTSDDAIYRAVKLACYELGFIDQDAELIAKAWRHRTPSDFNLHNWPSRIEDFQINSESLKPLVSCPQSLGLYVVAPSADWVGKLAAAGVPTVQLRFKSDDHDLIKREVQQAIQNVQDYPCHLFINDYWELAIEHKAYGVHLGQDDISTADINAIHAANMRLGISTHGYAEMLRAIQFRPSYIALGAIFPTTLKSMETAPQGIGRLKLYAQLLKDYPLVAIGGINEENISDVMACDIGSVALVRAVIQADDYRSAIKKLNSQICSI